MRTLRELAIACPNCGSTDRTTEPMVDENGTLTESMAIICVACGYMFGELPPLPPSEEAEDATKTVEGPIEADVI